MLTSEQIAAFQFTRSLCAGMSTCIDFDLKISWDHGTEGSEYDIRVLERRVEALNISTYLEAKPPLMSMRAMNEGAIRRCNDTMVQQWKNYVAATNGSEPEDVKKYREKQTLIGFQKYAFEAIQRMIKAFRIAGVPISLSSGALHCCWRRRRSHRIAFRHCTGLVPRVWHYWTYHRR